MTYNNQFFPFFVAFIVYVYALAAPRWRSAVLAAASFAWYWTWGPRWCVLLFFLSVVNFIMLKYGRKFLWWAVAGNLLVFVFLKALPHLFQTQSPYGVSFYFLSLLGFLIDQKRSTSDSEKIRFFDFFLVPAFFPALLTGPVLRSKMFAQFAALPGISLQNLADGGVIFFLGYFKHQLLKVKPFGYISAQVFANYGMSSPYFWIGCLVSTFIAYIDFSAYCDMGRGAAKCFGIDLDVNFKPFYYAKNPLDFWNRWNITLGGWIRDYLSFPLMLTFGKKVNQSVLVMFSFILVGLWHGLTLNWLLFGLFNGLLVAIYYRSSGHLIFGRVLVFILFVGNGLLTQKNLLPLLMGKVGQTHQRYPEPDWGLLALLLTGLFIFEYFQEREKDPDFYLKWPKLLRVWIFTALTGIFLWQFSRALSGGANFLPPVYFRF